MAIFPGEQSVGSIPIYMFNLQRASFLLLKNATAAPHSFAPLYSQPTTCAMAALFKSETKPYVLMHSPNNFQTHKKFRGTLWFGLVLFWDRLELAGSWNAGFLSDNSDSTTLRSVGEGKQKQTGSLLLRWIGLGCHLVWLRFDNPPSKTGLSCQKILPFINIVNLIVPSVCCLD